MNILILTSEPLKTLLSENKCFANLVDDFSGQVFVTDLAFRRLSSELPAIYKGAVDQVSAYILGRFG